MKIDSVSLNQRNFTPYAKPSEVQGSQVDQSVSVDTTAVAPVAQATATMTTKDLMEMKETNPNNMSISEKAIIEAIEKANKVLDGANKSFEFSIHAKTHQIMVKVINSDTKEVIREIPPEKILDMVAKMWEMAGIMVDERR